jgi:hypothetical protein
MMSTYWTGVVPIKPKTIFHKLFFKIKWYFGWLLGEKKSENVRNWRGTLYVKNLTGSEY